MCHKIGHFYLFATASGNITRRDLSAELGGKLQLNLFCFSNNVFDSLGHGRFIMDETLNLTYGKDALL